MYIGWICNICFEKQFVTFLPGRGIKVLTIYLLRDTTYIKRVINLAKLHFLKKDSNNSGEEMSVKISVFNKFYEGLKYINMKAKIDKMVLGIYFLFRSTLTNNVMWASISGKKKIQSQNSLLHFAFSRTFLAPEGLPFCYLWKTNSSCHSRILRANLQEFQRFLYRVYTSKQFVALIFRLRFCKTFLHVANTCFFCPFL